MFDFTEQELTEQGAELARMGISAYTTGSPADALILIGYLAQTLLFAMIAHPDDESIRTAAVRYEAYRRMLHEAAMRSTPLGVLAPPLATPASPVCLVDQATNFCQTHQGEHPAYSDPTDEQLERVLQHLKEQV